MNLHRFHQFNENKSNQILLIIDVQKSFKKFFTDRYVKAINKYCEQFDTVYQIWDNHVEGRNVDSDYLYDQHPDGADNDDLYSFRNQIGLIEKRYNYDVDAEFYKNILDEDTYNKMKENKLNKGDMFPTKHGTFVVFTANKHQFFHIPKKLIDLVKKNKSREFVIIGGADNECLQDLQIAMTSLGAKVTENQNYIYSGSHCPIK